MANYKKLIAAGYERVYYAKLNGNYAYGTASSITAGNQNGSGAGRLDGVKTSNVNIPEPETVQDTGDDGVMGQFIFPPNNTPSFVIETAVNDMDLAALAQDTKVEDDGDLSFGLLQPDDPNYIDMCLVLMRRAKSRVASSLGVSAWEGIIIPKANVVPLGSKDFTERGVAVYQYKVSTNVSGYYPWGKALTTSANGATGAPILTFSAANRIHIQTFVGDNTQDEFILTYTPASSAVAKCRVYVDGVIDTTVTIDVSTKTITFSAPPVNNAIIVVVYEHTV